MGNFFKSWFKKAEPEIVTTIDADKLKRKKLSDSFKSNIKPVKIKTKRQSFIIPKNLDLKEAKETLEAYRSGISNLFTSNDPTLTTAGYVRQFVDQGYYGDIIKALTIVEQDDLVGGLVDSVANNANTRMNFDLPLNNVDEGEIWNLWSKSINSDLKNILPGTTMLNEQILTSLLTTGMAVLDFEWGKLKVGKRIYDFPMNITILPSLSVRLQTDTTKFGREEVLVGVSEEFIKSREKIANSDVDFTPLFTERGDTELAILRKNAYAIKYRYNPNRPTLYPSPMLKRSFESIALRHKYIDADISTLEMIINKIIQIKVGDKDNQPQPTKILEDGQVQSGDVELAQDLFASMEDVVEVIATPYYYDIQVIMPDTSVLLNQTKYIQSTFNIYSNFGILLDPSSNGNSIAFEDLNLSNYERNAISMQNHVAGWYVWLIGQIMKRNGSKLKAKPSISFDKPEISDKDFLTGLKELYTIGGVDVFTLQEKYRLDPDKIKDRLQLQMQLETKTSGLYNARATFRQEVAGTGGVTPITNPTNATPKKAGVNVVSSSNLGGTNDKNKG